MGSGTVRRSLLVMSVTILVWGMWDRWWHLAGMVVCIIGWGLIEAVKPRMSAEEVVKEAKRLDQDLVRHMVSRTNSRAFGDWMADLAQGTKVQSIPSMSVPEQQILGTYLQHRTLGNVALASPAGMVAGWQLVMSTALLGTWFAGLLVHAGYEHEMDEALVASLWMLDQGFWCDESLVHEVLRYVQTRDLTSPALAQALTTALAGAASRI